MQSPNASWLTSYGMLLLQRGGTFLLLLLRAAVVLFNKFLFNTQQSNKVVWHAKGQTSKLSRWTLFEYFTPNDYSLLNTNRAKIPNFLRQMFRISKNLDCAAHQFHATVWIQADRQNIDNPHQTQEIMGFSEGAECVCLYKPVRSLALFFPSVVSGIKKTKGEKSVLQLIQTAPHRHIPERESLTCTSFGHAQSELRIRISRKRGTGWMACHVFLLAKEEEFFFMIQFCKTNVL